MHIRPDQTQIGSGCKSDPEEHDIRFRALRTRTCDLHIRCESDVYLDTRCVGLRSGQTQISQDRDAYPVLHDTRSVRALRDWECHRDIRSRSEQKVCWTLICSDSDQSESHLFRNLMCTPGYPEIPGYHTLLFPSAKSICVETVKCMSPTGTHKICKT